MIISFEKPTQIVRPMRMHDSIPDLSTLDLLMPSVCHVTFSPAIPEKVEVRAYTRKSEISRRINLDKKYRAFEPQIKVLREAGMTWYAVQKKMKINFHALEYCRKTLGMDKYGVEA